jgi:hypothetical protein
MCVGTGTAIAIGLGVGSTVAGVYAANKQAGAAHEAVTAQTTAADHAADLQAKSAADALEYTKQQAALARQDAETTQHGNYDQWRAAQVYQNATTAARTRNINALAAKWGVAPREIPEMAIPDYRPLTVGEAAAGPGPGAGAPAGAGQGSGAGPMGSGGDYQSWFLSQVAGKPVSQQTLLDLESSGALRQAGIELTPPNQAGERTKIKVPGVGWVRVGFGEGDWVWKPQPTAAAAAPGSVGAAMYGAPTASAVPAAAIVTPPINPALTVDPYQRRTVRDYFAA